MYQSFCVCSPECLPHYERVFRQVVSQQTYRYADVVPPPQLTDGVNFYRTSSNLTSRSQRSTRSSSRTPQRRTLAPPDVTAYASPESPVIVRQTIYKYNKGLCLFNPTFKLNHALILSFIYSFICSFIQTFNQPVSFQSVIYSLVYLIQFNSIHHQYHTDMGWKTLPNQSEMIQLSLFPLICQ